MTAIPFKHLTVANVREFLAVRDTGGNVLDVLHRLSREAQNEMEALAHFGKGKSGFDYDWYLEPITMADWHDKWSPIDVRLGMKKLGLANELNR